MQKAVWRLWVKVQEVNHAAKRFGRQSLGGMNRTESSRKYLFSGTLKCGVCFGAMNVVGGGETKRRAIRYGCRRHRYEGRCENNVTIRLVTLEEQLLNAIVEKLQPPVLEKYIGAFRTQIEEYLAKESNPELGRLADLKKREAELEKERRNVTRAIAAGRQFDALFEELARIEADAKQVRDQLRDAASPRPIGLSFEEFKSFVCGRASELKSVLRGDPVVAKQIIKHLVPRLVLAPQRTSEGAVFLVSGDIDLFAGDSGVVLDTALYHDAKQYASPLTLTGLLLKPCKVNRPRNLADGKPPSSPPSGSESGWQQPPA